MAKKLKERTTTTVTVAGNDLEAAAAAYIAAHAEMAGWDLSPAWADETHTSVVLTVPVAIAQALASKDVTTATTEAESCAISVTVVKANQTQYTFEDGSVLEIKNSKATALSGRVTTKHSVFAICLTTDSSQFTMTDKALYAALVPQANGPIRSVNKYVVAQEAALGSTAHRFVIREGITGKFWTRTEFGTAVAAL